MNESLREFREINQTGNRKSSIFEWVKTGKIFRFVPFSGFGIDSGDAFTGGQFGLVLEDQERTLEIVFDEHFPSFLS